MVELSDSPSCNACGGLVSILHNFGSQALTNDFPSNPDLTVRAHPLILGQCGVCGLVQLCDPCPAELAKPAQAMHYNEPEGHLDALVEEIVASPGVSPASRVCGLTYKDASTLERLGQRGYDDLTILSVQDDFQIADDCAGLETIQTRVTPELADVFVARHGKFDVVLVRHLLEHAHELASFLAAVKRLTTPGGYIIFEVPDCTTMFNVFDYSFLWEEHISYFTPWTLANTLCNQGLDPWRVLTYPNALENSLVAMTRQAGTPLPSAKNHADALASERQLAERYARNFLSVRSRWQKRLALLRQTGPIAILGAGHLLVTFVNLMELEPLIDFVCDDAADKINRFIPGTRLRISSREGLVQQPFSICLMAVAPESEPTALVKNLEFIDRGGRFASIFAASDYALKLDAAGEPASDQL